jgi:hypothetical protein
MSFVGGSSSGTIAGITDLAGLLVGGPVGAGRLRLVGKGTCFKDGQVTNSSGSAQTTTTGVHHPIPRETYGLRVVYANIKTTSLDALPANDIVVKAAVDYFATAASQSLAASAAVFPLYFNGVRSVTIKPGWFAISDPIMATMAAGSVVTSRTAVTVNNTEVYPKNAVIDGVSVGSDLADSGTIATGGIVGYSPVALVGQVWNGSSTAGDILSSPPSVFVIGDSINPESTSGYPWVGFTGLSTPPPYIFHNTGGVSFSTYAPTWPGGASASGWLRLQMGVYCKYAICQLGVNQTSAASVSAWLAAARPVWRALRALGCKVVQTTVTPASSSGGTYSTIAGQASNNGAAFLAYTGTALSVRRTLNAYLLANYAAEGLHGVIDAAMYAEDATNPNLWAVPAGDGGGTNRAGQTITSALTTDGTHPTDPYGASVIAGAVTAAAAAGMFA